MRLPADIAARNHALSPDKSFIVQAPAGSGKTGLLVRRFLTLLALVDAPEEILAITFTRKATAEMRQRIINALRGVNDEGQPEQDPELLELAQRAAKNDQHHDWQLKVNSRRLRVQTIDSFCNELVHRMPWSSRFGAAPSVVEDGSLLYLRAARLTLDHIEDRGDPRRAKACGRLLEMMDANFQRARELLADMLARRDKWMRLLRNYDQDLLESWWQKTIDEQLSACDVLLTNEMRSEMSALANIAASNLDQQEQQSTVLDCLEMTEFPEPTFQNIHLWRGIAGMLLTQNLTLRKRVNKNDGFPTSDRISLNRIKTLLETLRDDKKLELAFARIANLPDGHFSEAQWLNLDAILKLLPVAAAELRLLFRETNQADYIELAQRAELALGEPDDPTDLALAFDYRLKHLLMDEFQDTSGGQIELLEKLVAGWQIGDGRSAFFVGDPMQSIYRFREAEVGNFLETQTHGIGQVQTEPLVLECNFRSAPALVHWFNHTFCQVMPAKSEIIHSAVSYSPAIAHQTNEADCAVTMHPSIDSDAESEAGLIADLIRVQLEKYPEQSIAVLGRTRSGLNPVARVLSQRKIPFQAIKLRKLREQQAIQDLAALTRALIQPADRTAWVSLLRTPWCGMSLRDISILCESDKIQPLVALWSDPSKLASISTEGQARLKNLGARMAQGLHDRGHISLARNLEAVWLGLGGPCAIHSVDLADCQRFIDLVKKLEHDEAAITADSLDDAMENLWASSESPAAVQLLTVHAAKGLEFDTVILPNLDRQPRSTSRELLRFKNFPDRLLMAPRPTSGESDGRCYDYLGKVEKEHQHNEATRLLYVACTRAQKNLHLFGNCKTNSKDELGQPGAGSLLALLWPIVEPEFQKKHAETTILINERESELSFFDFPLTRLPLQWQLPDVMESVQVNTGQGRPAPGNGTIEFSWAGEISRICGILIHQILQQVDRVGWPVWCKQPIDQKTLLLWRNRLIEKGTPGESLNDALDQVHKAIESTRQDPQAAWIFSSDHVHIKTEWPVSGVIGKQIVHAIIDRSFVDKNDVRWIIDFKSSRHEDQHNLDWFINEERTRYGEKMSIYADIIGELDRRKIRTALYYPLLKRFVEL